MNLDEMLANGGFTKERYTSDGKDFQTVEYKKREYLFYKGELTNDFGGSHEKILGKYEFEGIKYLKVKNNNVFSYYDKQGNRFKIQIQMSGFQYLCQYNLSSEYLEITNILLNFMFDEGLIYQIDAINSLNKSIKKQKNHYNNIEDQRNSMIHLLESLKYQITKRPETFDLGGVKS